VTDFPRECLLADPVSVTYEALRLLKSPGVTFFSFNVSPPGPRPLVSPNLTTSSLAGLPRRLPPPHQQPRRAAAAAAAAAMPWCPLPPPPRLLQTPLAFKDRLEKGRMDDLKDIMSRWQPWIPPKLDQSFQQVRCGRAGVLRLGACWAACRRAPLLSPALPAGLEPARPRVTRAAQAA